MSEDNTCITEPNLEEECKSWLKKVEKKLQKAYCIICSKTIDIAHGGSSVLQSHQKGKLTVSLSWKGMRTGSVIYSKKESADSTTANEVQVVSTCAKSLFVISEDVLDAEIIWCVHLVQSHQSYWSCNPLPMVFWKMFKSSSAAIPYEKR